MRKIKNIWIGWGKRFGWIQTSEAEKALSELRVRQCTKCPFAKVSSILEIIDGKGEFVNTLFCDKCKCPAKEKSLVLKESCPIGNW